MGPSGEVSHPHSHLTESFGSDINRERYSHSVSANIFRLHTCHLLWKCQVLECVFMGWKCAEGRSQRSRRPGTCYPNRIPSYCELNRLELYNTTLFFRLLVCKTILPQSSRNIVRRCTTQPLASSLLALNQRRTMERLSRFLGLK